MTNTQDIRVDLSFLLIVMLLTAYCVHIENHIDAQFEILKSDPSHQWIEAKIREEQGK